VIKNNILLACSKNWFLKNPEVKKFIRKKNVILIRKKKQLTLKKIKEKKISLAFFPHWSFKVEQNILDNATCICFHTSPLPYGRGGSPIQNLIKKKFKKSPVCALKMVNNIDGGPIYLKKTVSLSGNLDQIFERLAIEIIKMIKTLKKKKIKPKIQIGKPFYFKRIGVGDNKIKNIESIYDIYNKIRMLDSKDYSNAYIIFGKYIISFNSAKIKNNKINCTAKIIEHRKN